MGFANNSGNYDPKVVYRVKLKQYIKTAAESNARRMYLLCTSVLRDALVRIANGFWNLSSPVIVRTSTA
jgi:hypothetical protein